MGREVRIRISIGLVVLCFIIGSGIAAQVFEVEKNLDARLFEVTLAGTALAVVSLGVTFVLRRATLLLDVYTKGYRHGRNDANKSLLDSGMWLPQVPATEDSDEGD